MPLPCWISRHQRIGLLHHPHQARLVGPGRGHHRAHVGRGLSQVGARGPAVGEDVLELAVGRRRVEPGHRLLERPRHPGEGVRGGGHVAGSRGRCGWSARRRTSPAAGRSRPGPSRSAAGAVSAVLSKAWPIRCGDVADVARDAAGLGGELADVGQGGAGPGFAAGQVGLDQRVAHDWGRSGSGSKETMFALHSPKRLAEAEITAGLAGSSHRAVHAELGLHPLVLAPGGSPPPGRPGRRGA